MKAIAASARSWVAGTLVAFAGVALARFVAPSLSGTERLGTTLTGQLLALGGLFIICLGVRRRIRLAADRPDRVHPGPA